MKKKIFTVCLAICLIAILTIGGTLAWFTDTETKSNIMTVGKIDIDLEERMMTEDGFVPFEDCAIPVFPMNNEDGIASYNKVVDVYNDGPNDAYIRTIVAIESFSVGGYEDQEGFMPIFHHSYANQVVESEHIQKIAIGDKNYIVLVFDQADKTPVAQGERIQSLQSLWLDASVTQEMVAPLEGDLEVLVLAQGIQTVGFDSYDEAMATFGEINSENLTKWFAEAYDAVINDHNLHVTE